MKIFWIVFSLTLVALNLSGQSNNIFQLEAGMSMNNENIFTSEYAQGLNINGTIRFQHKSFELGLRYKHAIGTLGIEAPYNFRIGLGGSWFVKDRTSEFANYNSLQLLVNYCPNFKNFKPILGIGVGRNRFTYKEIFYDNDLMLTAGPASRSEPLSKKYYSLIYRFGFKIKNIRYGIFIHPKKDPHDRIIETIIGYNFALSKKQSTPKHTFDFHYFWKTTPVLMRLEIGRSLIVPMESNSSASARFFVNLQGRLNKKSFLGVSYEARATKSKGMGHDANTVRLIDVDSMDQEFVDQLFVRTTKISTSISALKGYFQRIENYAPNIDLFYGAGLGMYRIDKVGERKSWGVYIPPVIKKSRNIGLYMFMGFRTGIYSNKIEFNIPFGNIPPYVGLQTAVGLQWRKKHKSSE